jgi:(E)-4-hydroxy-3-methylbut-2-enyl-diphosphate synthase
MGGEHPVRVQSMANTSTLDTGESVRQCIRIIEAGGEYVRLTAQGTREAENLRNIKAGLRKAGYHTPLIADIHFNSKAAEVAAGIVEKVRINPGNFAGTVKSVRTPEYSEAEYDAELQNIRERFLPFLAICKQNRTAIRIGVNHGSLSGRIMSRYGDTPLGMVESCMEFLRLCVAEDFYNVVISIKASNTFVMVRTVRLLVSRMEEEGMQFPLHLGVTEAGDGEDGRIKSATGIGALLLEGIGDTIRVSLSEDPEAEIPVARLLLDYVREKEKLPQVASLSPETLISPAYNPFNPERRKTVPAASIGGSRLPVVISDRSVSRDFETDTELIPDFIYAGKHDPGNIPENTGVIMDFGSFTPAKNRFPLFTAKEKNAWKTCEEDLQFIRLSYNELDEEIRNFLKEKPQTVVIIESENNAVYEQKAFIHSLMNWDILNPVIIRQFYREEKPEAIQVKSAVDCGSFFLDMLADGIMLSQPFPGGNGKLLDACAFGILQATGRRISKTEYISCPSCGRTLFDLQTAIKKVKSATSHLKGLKIAIMGCIVNGPGEMADADYGYVGAGRGKVSLYKGKECLLKNIPEEKAVEELLKLIASDTVVMNE